MGKTTKVKGLFNKDGEPIIDQDREMQERIDRLNKKMNDHEKTKKEAKALYEKAIALLKEAADKDDNFAALFYGMHLMYGKIKDQFNAPWEDKENYSEAMKYLTYASSLPSESWEIAGVVYNFVMSKAGYNKINPAYGMHQYKDPRVTQAELEYLNESDRLSKDPTLTPQERASRITQAYNRYQQTVRPFSGIGMFNTINPPVFMNTGSPSVGMP